MKKAISIFRIAILALMGSVGVLFLLGEKQASSGRVSGRA